MTTTPTCRQRCPNASAHDCKRLGLAQKISCPGASSCGPRTPATASLSAGDGQARQAMPAVAGTSSMLTVRVEATQCRRRWHQAHPRGRQRLSPAPGCRAHGSKKSGAGLNQSPQDEDEMTPEFSNCCLGSSCGARRPSWHRYPRCPQPKRNEKVILVRMSAPSSCRIR